MNDRGTIWIWLMVGMSSCLACGAVSPRTAGDEVEFLPLDQCIDRALLHNLQLRVRRYGPSSAVEGVQAAEAAFDVNLDARGDTGASQTAQASSELDGSEQPTTDSRSASVGIEKRFSPGASVRLGTSIGEYDTDSEYATLNPAIDTAADLTITQPLLKNAGALVNRAAVTRAEINVLREDEALRAAALDVVRDIELAYWGLALQQERLLVSRSALDLSRSLLQETEAKVEQGLKTKVDVLQARADVAAKEEAVTVGEQGVGDAQDALARLMRRLAELEDGALAVSPLPEAPPPAPDEDTSFARALDLQPEYRILQKNLEENELDLDVARRRDRPELNLVGQGGVAGKSDDRADAYDGMFAGEGYNWKLDLVFRYPLGLREEGARAAQAYYGVAQGGLRLEDAEEQILQDVRARCRGVRTGLERIRIARVARELNEQQVEQERGRFDAGLITVRNVLDAQDDLNEARLRVLVAVRDTIEAVVQLGRLEGSLLETHGIDWKPIEERAKP